MDIEAKEFTIKMTHCELWGTAWDVRYSLCENLKSHWINHQDAWERNEQDRLYRLKTMFNHLGRLDLYEDVFNIAETIFSEFNNKNK